MSSLPSPVTLPWVTTVPGVPYFQTEDGAPWHPIGQNDAMSWVELNPLFRRRDVAAVEQHVAWLAAHGVTTMRLMLEYAQGRHRFFETSAGVWSPNVVRFWDDLFGICERRGMRLLLTPFDTFWLWRKFKHHPYNHEKGGPLSHPSRTLLSRETREAIKGRLAFAAERWGGSGALFAWDLWNEIHPAHAEMSAEPFVDFIAELSEHVRAVEKARFGRVHLQTVSMFGPELHLSAHMKMEHAIFRHPALDFATIHVYEHGTVDDPKNTVDAAVGMGRIVQKAIAEITDNRPFLDTEHGPIHTFKDKHKTLPEPFDDEYFRHMQWAHLASGGAGGGMRWPNRHPHTLTVGMRLAQGGLARFMPLLEWTRFARTNVSDDLRVRDGAGQCVAEEQVARFGCATPDQALLYLLRRDCVGGDGKLDRGAAGLAGLCVRVPGLGGGQFLLTAWDTVGGATMEESVEEIAEGGWLKLPVLAGDMAVALRRVGGEQGRAAPGGGGERAEHGPEPPENGK